MCTVFAIDEDADQFGDPVYVLHSGNEAGHFRIDNSTGMIYLVKSLDREVVNIFELTIYAYNHGSNIARKRRDTGSKLELKKYVFIRSMDNESFGSFKCGVCHSLLLKFHQTNFFFKGDNFDVLKVVIEVTDINDNYPEFDQINYVAGKVQPGI